MEVNFQIYHYWRSKCAMKGVSLEVNFQIYHYWRSECAMKGVNMCYRSTREEDYADCNLCSH